MPVRTDAVMGTLVTIQAVRGGAEAAIDRAFEWFHEVEARCTRFNPGSELMQLTARAGQPAEVSAILFEALSFALQVADETGGAFDPTIGHRMAARGFNQEHRSGDMVTAAALDEDVSYRDVQLDAERRTVTLRRPLTLDLGAVAKGLAVDLAARELAEWEDFAVDAGGDLFLSGLNPEGSPWLVGIRHPRRDGGLIESVRVSGHAICTSGDYERPAAAGAATLTQGAGGSEHHILDPRTGASPDTSASVTVIAPGAMLADALGTAAFVLGPAAGIELLNRMGVQGLILTTQLERHETPGWGDAVA